MSVSENKTTTKWQMVFPSTKKINSDYHLAQFNIAVALYPLDDLRMEGFVSRLDDINSLADSSPGFVWRLISETGNPQGIAALNDPALNDTGEIVNLSVWQSIDQLFEFTYVSAHTSVMAKRKQWFSRASSSSQVLWWIEAGSVPSLQEAMQKLAVLDSTGPGPDAFTFKKQFMADGSACVV